MPGTKLTNTATVTTTATVELQVQPHVRQMLKQRAEEHAQLAREIKERKQRQDRIAKELGELFAKEGQEEALAAGAEIDGFRVKRVGGTSRTLNREALQRALDLTSSELDAFYDEKPRKAYIRITAPGEKDGDD